MSFRILAGLSLLLLVACVTTLAPSPTPSIEGREFVSTSVTEDGTERALVGGTVIRLTFREGRIGASAGCNQIGGDYALDDGRLHVANLASTAMGCDPARHDQDEWLTAFLGAGPTVVLDGAELVLEAGSARIVLVDDGVAAPNLPLGNAGN